MRVYAVTPNPALDLSGHVSCLVPNEKNYVERPRLDPGGNGINAARIAHRLGARVLNLGFAGGPTGEQLKSLLKKERIAEKFTKITGSTRTNVTATNDFDHAQTRLTFPGPRVSRAEAAKLLAQVRKLKAPGVILLGGSLPQGLPSDFHARLARSAHEAGLGIVADVPARHLKTLLRALGREVRALLLKPNLAELEEYAGMHFHDESEIAAAARVLNDKAALVCVSLGGDGAIMVSKKDVWLARPPKVRARGSVGAGDSMVGAMAARLARLKLLTPEALECSDRRVIGGIFAWGLAAGVATASTEGTKLGSAELIGKLHRSIRQK